MAKASPALLFSTCTKKKITKNRIPRASCPAAVKTLAKADFARLTTNGCSVRRGRNAPGWCGRSWVSSAGKKEPDPRSGGYVLLIPCLFSV